MTGRDRYLTESVRGTDRAARKQAEKALTRLLAEVDKQRVPETAVPLSRRWTSGCRRSRLRKRLAEPTSGTSSA